MKPIILDSDYMDMSLGFAYRFLTNQSVLTTAHTHNYYEYFLITAGSIEHIVNGQKSLLKKGDLVIIRPNDYHQYCVDSNTVCQLINISFRSVFFDNACHYLGEDVIERICVPEQPPLLNIDNLPNCVLVQEHDFLNFHADDKGLLTLQIRFLIIHVLTLFIKHPTKVQVVTSRDSLESLLDQMKTPENVEEGIPALLRITGFSHGHLCRTMKEHLNISPLEYITNLRMEYASNLLINSDEDILTISLKMGYSSLSHFITVFKKKYGCSPKKFRQQYACIKHWK